MRHLPLLACLLTVAPIAQAQETPTTEQAATGAPAATPVQPAAAQEKQTQKEPSNVRSKGMDLRHCLELQDNAAIAKCAGE
ncbi:MAG: hypothetical protein AB1722_06295 [Pseudomonadota bacterium]